MAGEPGGLSWALFVVIPLLIGVFSNIAAKYLIVPLIERSRTWLPKKSKVIKERLEAKRKKRREIMIKNLRDTNFMKTQQRRIERIEKIMNRERQRLIIVMLIGIFLMCVHIGAESNIDPYMNLVATKPVLWRTLFSLYQVLVWAFVGRVTVAYVIHKRTKIRFDAHRELESQIGKSEK